MEIKPISERMTTKNRRVLVLLLAFAFLLILFAASSVQPAYATGTPSGPQIIVPGPTEPDPFTYAPNTIEGIVYGYSTGSNAAGITVNLSYGTSLVAIQADSRGYFQFYTGIGFPDQPIILIQPNTQYRITVNGGSYGEMGGWIPDPTWGQWAGNVITDSNGWAGKHIPLQPAAIVYVPAAAIFSNTRYATVSYEYQSTYTVSHSLTFSVSVAGITVGYQSGETATSGVQVVSDPNTAVVLSKKYYAASYWDDTASPPGIKKTGISGRERQWDWVASNTDEYLSTTDSIVVNNHKEENVGFNLTIDFYYYEQGSTTWSVTQGIPFAVSYLAWGTNIDLNVAVTTSASDRVDFTINRHNDPNPNQLTFWLYTAGALIDTDNHHGGMEFHVWDYSGAG